MSAIWCALTVRQSPHDVRSFTERTRKSNTNEGNQRSAPHDEIAKAGKTLLNADNL